MDVLEKHLQQDIIVKGAAEHNLKSVDVRIPRNSFTVISGLSGSGKSSLAFDTLFAEGQRMYVESLSAYVRQFLGRMEKPQVEAIYGLSPAIAIEQKTGSRSSRSTVGTVTEIYDYLKLLFARIGRTFSPISGREVKRHTVQDVVDFILSQAEGTKLCILAPIHKANERSWEEELRIILQKGFSRIFYENEIKDISQLLEDPKNIKFKKSHPVYLLIDRLALRNRDDETLYYRLSDSVQTAFFEGHDECYVLLLPDDMHHFSDKFELDGMTFEEPSVALFSFNNPYGACPTCEGFGTTLGISEELVIPDPSLSVYSDAVAPWRTPRMNEWKQAFIKQAHRYGFPIHKPYEDLSAQEKELLWYGKEELQGIYAFFDYIASQAHKIQYRVFLSRYRGRTLCPDCRGTRIRKEASYVKIQGVSIQELVLMPIDQLAAFFGSLQLNEPEQQVARRLLIEIKNRLHYMQEVGLGYLTLNRAANTLSGGEYQRMRLTTSLGSALVGSMYILDEPSIGLHPRDTHRLVSVLKKLRDIGNTVIVVEHEEEVIRSADYLIDIGPEAGTGGGEIVFQGKIEEADEAAVARSYTLRYLNGQLQIPTPTLRRPWTQKLRITGAAQHNLKKIDVTIPLGVLTVIAGVSGSGKSTLVKRILYPALARRLDIKVEEESGKFKALEGDVAVIKDVQFIDQRPMGRSSRSNPVTYIKAYDAIRELYASQPLAKARGYKPGTFSFNIEGGRCENCQGEGEICIEMQFMADIHITCEVCGGKRFKPEVLEVEYKGKSIADVLDMTVEEALRFFEEEKKIAQKLQLLHEVGLGYVRLGQSASTLSGGEAQRLKLATFLDGGGSHKGHTLFIFDEPTTGLHIHDIHKLLKALQALIEQGNSVLIIEHNVEVIKSADWLIELGPEGGEAGGYLLYEGIPEGLLQVKESPTAPFLKNHLSNAK